MSEESEIQPPPEGDLGRLAREVEALRARKIEKSGGVSLDVQTIDASIEAERLGRAGILSIGDVMPAAIEVFGRMEVKMQAYREEIRPQFDAAAESITCDAHPKERRRKEFEATIRISRESGTFIVDYSECSQCIADRENAKMRAYWRKRGVPERMTSASLETFTAPEPHRTQSLQKAAEWAARRGVFLVLYGSPGTGKTWLAVSLLRAYGAGLFITHVDMLMDLRTSYVLHDTETRIRAWRDASFLVLDEFGLSPGGKDEEPMLYQVLAGRYDARRPTIITTNLDLREFKDSIGYRLLDRIAEDAALVPCVWQSYRREK